MQDKLISPDTSRKAAMNSRFLLYIIAFLLVAATIVTSFINANLNEKFKGASDAALEFAANIELICTVENLDEKYPNICVHAQQHVENPRLNTAAENVTPTDIQRITCEEDRTVIYYRDGTSTIARTTCEK